MTAGPDDAEGRARDASATQADGAVAAAARRRSSNGVAFICLGVVFLMIGASFAAVPLYQLFCQVTGFGGTPQIGLGPAAHISDKVVSVRFDANVAPGITWKFQADQPTVDVRLGETKTVFYTITNTGSAPSTGVATFNVQPELAGQFFVKIQCFCFEEQTLQPGETIHAPVVFYVDPDLQKQPETKDLDSLTLSYTVFRAKNDGPVARTGKAADASAEKNNL